MLLKSFISLSPFLCLLGLTFHAYFIHPLLILPIDV